MLRRLHAVDDYDQDDNHWSRPAMGAQGTGLERGVALSARCKARDIWRGSKKKGESVSGRAENPLPGSKILKTHKAFLRFLLNC